MTDSVEFLNDMLKSEFGGKVIRDITNMGAAIEGEGVSRQFQNFYTFTSPEIDAGIGFLFEYGLYPRP